MCYNVLTGFENRRVYDLILSGRGMHVPGPDRVSFVILPSFGKRRRIASEKGAFSTAMEHFDYSDRYLRLLSQKFRTVQEVSTELINLEAILALPKGTEHFMSDIHGEDEAFAHILNNCSGVVRDKIDAVYGDTLTAGERAELATLIYYPEHKLEYIKAHMTGDLGDWYRVTLRRLSEICRVVASKYTRSKVRKALPADFAYIIDELLNTDPGVKNKENYYNRIITSIIEINRADAFITAIAGVIKRLAVDRLHIIGDVFDRGPRPDHIMDMLMHHHSVDIQWGNHDMLWMGAACGSEACIFNILGISVKYSNMEMLERGYGISLRHLTNFAQKTYADGGCFAPKVISAMDREISGTDSIARLYKAVLMIQFKLEGQAIMRNPSFCMEDRLLLDKIDYQNRSITIGGVTYALEDCDFPTVDKNDPYRLTDEEQEIVSELRTSFAHSPRLQEHMEFLYRVGSMYLCFNENLLYHGCLPMNEDGSFAELAIDGKMYAGRDLMDILDQKSRFAWVNRKKGGEDQRKAVDLMWYMWCGKKSPLFGRDRMTTFERCLIEDKSAHTEPKNAYYRHTADPAVCDRILREFGLEGEHAHIINGHMPVKIKDGESPIHGGGKMLIIDGGFSRAYQKTTGIAGYTLVYNAHGLKLISHEPFKSREDCVTRDDDILSKTEILESLPEPQKVADSDIGRELQTQIDGLKQLLAAYRSGTIKEANLRP